MNEGRYAGVIGVGGLVLARIPEEIALQIDAYYKKQNEDKRRSSREQSFEGTAPKYEIPKGIKYACNFWWYKEIVF